MNFHWQIKIKRYIKNQTKRVRHSFGKGGSFQFVLELFQKELTYIIAEQIVWGAKAIPPQSLKRLAVIDKELNYDCCGIAGQSALRQFHQNKNAAKTFEHCARKKNRLFGAAFSCRAFAIVVRVAGPNHKVGLFRSDSRKLRKRQGQGRQNHGAKVLHEAL